MDSLTHLLIGHAMGTLASSISPTAGPAVYWAALIGNSLPDIDLPVSLATGRGIQLHRTYSHTLPGVVLLSAAASALLARHFTAAGIGPIFIWMLLGSLVHVLVDCLNLFGARPFWPFDGRAVELGVLHILDPFLLALLGLPALGVHLLWNQPELVAMGFVAIWPYICYRLITARRLIQKLKGGGSLRARVVPWFTGWRYILETEEAVEFGRWRRGKRLAIERFPKRADPRIAASMADPRVSRFLRSAEYPVALVQGDAVVWIDAVRRLRADFRPLRVQVGS